MKHLHQDDQNMHLLYVIKKNFHLIIYSYVFMINELMFLLLMFILKILQVFLLYFLYFLILFMNVVQFIFLMRSYFFIVLVYDLIYLIMHLLDVISLIHIHYQNLILYQMNIYHIQIPNFKIIIILSYFFWLIIMRMIQLHKLNIDHDYK